MGTCFDYDTFTELKNTLFGKYDPAVYITQNRFTTEYNRTKSSVITATQINAKITETANQKYGYILKLGGLDWVVASMTLGGYNSSTGEEGNVPVLTLYLADDLTDDDGNWITTAFLDDNLAADSNTKGRSMYSSSTLRKNITTGAYSKLALFADTSENSFAKRFLVQPNDIKYQHKQTMYGRQSGEWYNMPNEALDAEDVLNGKYSSGNTYRRGFYYDGTANGANGLYAKYEDWGEDYIWIPSLTEVGCSTVASTTNIWMMTNEQKRHTPTEKVMAWCRNGHDTTLANYSLIGLKATAERGDLRANQEGYVRPAIHLNLSMVEEFAGIPEPPSEIEDRTYNGQPQYLTTESWYRKHAAVFDDPNECQITYKKGTTTLAGVPTDAGTYKAEIRLLTNKHYWSGTSAEKMRDVSFTILPKELDGEFSEVGGVPKLTLYNQPFTGDAVNPVIKYYLSGQEVAAASIKPKTEYEAEVTLDNANYVLKSTIQTKISYTPSAARVKPSFVPDSSVYSGEEQTFFLSVGNGIGFTAALKENYGSDVKKVPGTETQFTAVNAGKYTVVVTLTNNEDYVWEGNEDSADYEIDFEITPYPIALTLPGYAQPLSVTYGNTIKNVSIEMQPLLSGNLQVYVGAYYAGSWFMDLCAIDLSTAGTHSESFTLDTARLPKNITYDLGINYGQSPAANAKNYTVDFAQPYSVAIKEPSLAGGVNWRLMADGMLVGEQRDPDAASSATYDGKITYTGKSYYFTINASGIGYQVDTSYNQNDFTNGYKIVKKSDSSVIDSARVKDAGTYIAYVHLKKEADASEENFGIEFTIDKAKFDLSGVRWLPENGKIAFSARMSIIIDPDTLPEGLGVQDYDGTHSATAITDKGRAGVIFKVSDSKNYVAPVSTDSTTYKFTPNSGLDDFEWSKDWEVIPAEIPVVWTVGTITTSGNKKINVKMLAGDYDAYLDYVYYESDGRGSVAEGATPVTELEIIEGTVKYYVAEVSIKENFQNEYKLEAGKSNRSTVFEVGHTLLAIQLAARKTTYSYWGSPVEFQFKVTQGTITSDAFEITYYKGALRQGIPPEDVGSYTAKISLKSEYANDYYIDGVSSFEYTIERAVIKINWNENTKPPVLKITQAQKSCVSYEYIDSSGDPVVSFGNLELGVYKVRAVINGASTKNYIFDNNLTFTDWIEFTVTNKGELVNPDNSGLYDPSADPNVSKILVTIYPDGSTSATFSNSENLDPNIYFNVKYYSIDESRYLEAGEVPNLAGRYRAEIALKDEYLSKYDLTGNIFSFTLSDSVQNPPTEEKPNNNGTTGDDPSDNSIISYLPLILSGVSLALIIVFTAMTFNNLAAAKEAKEKTKKLAQVTYSCAPAGLLAPVFGLSERNWWIIAGVLTGLALMMAIVAFMAKGKKKRALALLEEEKERIEDEKEMARFDREEQARAEMREEQARRDNEMKMMFAAMQQGGYQQPMYDDSHMQNMIASTISALLPTIQQQMALPPAQDQSAYAQPGYGAPNPEADALRAQLAAQEERMARQQEQMAQQQELLNQILQNQQQTQQVYEEEPVDDVSWLGESDEVISLEESYGALSDEGRRAYYEIGSYIMNKPRTSQNDGRYAVLFKYRGRTIFKLCIKDDAPVLYYPAGNGKAEVRVADASSLEVAKGVIDRTVARVDGQM